ncbi:TldD/PmbA family protein [Viscerimonas tarda]
MISTLQKEIAQQAMDIALNNGCQAARVSVITAKNNSFEYRNSQLDKLHQSSENKIYIELFVDGRYGAVSTNRIDRQEIEKLIIDGIVSTRYLAPDIFRQLPDPSRYYKQTGTDLDLYDTSFNKLSAEQKIDLAKQAADEIYQADSRIVSVAASYDDGCSAEYMLASNGFEAETADTAFSLSVEVALKTGSDARPESYWHDDTVYWDDLQKTGIAQKALERAIRKIGQKKIRSGQYNMLLDNTVSSRLFTPLIAALYGSALQQKNSFLLNKLGEKITNDKLTITDRPHLPRSFGARWFDGEGVATCERTIIDKGVLQSYFIDTYNSLKMKVMPSISSPSILVAGLGSRNFEGLMKTMGKGIWVTAFNGGNCNPTTGDFSFGIEGFLVENGILVQAIGEMNITGNMLSLWDALVEPGNDPRKNSSYRIPSLLFSDISFSGC